MEPSGRNLAQASRLHAGEGALKARKGSLAPMVDTSAGSSALAEIVTPSAPF
jgi:hypothetical protein